MSVIRQQKYVFSGEYWPTMGRSCLQLDDKDGSKEDGPPKRSLSPGCSDHYKRRYLRNRTIPLFVYRILIRRGVSLKRPGSSHVVIPGIITPLQRGIHSTFQRGSQPIVGKLAEPTGPSSSIVLINPTRRGPDQSK